MFKKRGAVIDSRFNGSSPKQGTESPENGFGKISKAQFNLLKVLSNFQFGESDSRAALIVGLLIVLILSVLSVHLSLWSKSNQEKTNYVQKSDGVTEVVYQLNNDERNPETLRRFAFTWFKACFTWTGKFNGQVDSGAPFNDSRIPTVLDKCQLAVNSNIRAAFIGDLINRYKDDPTFKDKLAPYNFTQSAFREGREIQIEVKPFAPKKIATGKWEMDIGATRTIKLGGLILEEPFNWTLTLAAIPPYEDPLLKEQTEFGKLLNAWTIQGVKIDNLKRR
jgi:hypothetical protein